MGVYDGYLGGNSNHSGFNHKKNKRKLTQELMKEYGEDLTILEDPLAIKKLSED
jgi:hypothetical protein